MAKKKKKSNSLGNMKVPNWALALIVLAVAGFGAYFVYSSFAATAFSAELIFPANEATVTSPPQFVTAVRGVTTNGVTTQVIYRKHNTTTGKGDMWTTFGTQAAKGTSVGKGPDGLDIYVNGIGGTGKNYDYVNTTGWNCAMGWGSDAKNPRPLNCATKWKGALPAFPDYKIYSPTARLFDNSGVISDYSQYGKYEWAARSSVNGGKTFSSWSKVNTFTYAAKAASCTLTYGKAEGQNALTFTSTNAVSGLITTVGGTVATMNDLTNSSGGSIFYTAKPKTVYTMTVFAADHKSTLCKVTTP